jgi:hypothetical protein
MEHAIHKSRYRPSVSRGTRPGRRDTKAETSEKGELKQ